MHKCESTKIISTQRRAGSQNIWVKILLENRAQFIENSAIEKFVDEMEKAAMIAASAHKVRNN